MTPAPQDYQWSSNAADRRKAYRALFRQPLAEDFLSALRAATNGGWAMGDDRFKREIAQALGRSVAPLPRGRPRKAGDKDQLNLL